MTNEIKEIIIKAINAQQEEIFHNLDEVTAKTIDEVRD